MNGRPKSIAHESFVAKRVGDGKTEYTCRHCRGCDAGGKRIVKGSLPATKAGTHLAHQCTKVPTQLKAQLSRSMANSESLGG
jgi:hypothetical protein